MKRRRVVITGMGMINAAGMDCEQTWNSVVISSVNARSIKRFDASGFLTQIAYEVDDDYKNKYSKLLSEYRDLPRAFDFGLIAADEAWKSANLNHAQVKNDKFSVVMGIGMGTDDFSWFLESVKNPETAKLNKLQPEPVFLASKLAKKYHAHHHSSIHTACASSAQAIGEAYDMIALGEADVVMSGGADAMIEPLQLAGFGLLGALSINNEQPKEAQRSFDMNRGGFVLGEGASVLILEDLDVALSRGANIIAEICGYGVSASAYRITDLNPDGTGPREAITCALKDAGIDQSAVNYINAHGTGTFQNDVVESKVIKEIFTHAKVSSTKTITGHLISGAGAIECALSAKALKEQILPPSVNVSQQDDECPVLLTEKSAVREQMEYAISNSIGFGGSNVSIVLKRWA